MVFSSIPMYLDPHNWPLQQPNLEPGGGGVLASNDARQLLPPAPAPLGGQGSIRPGSMAERAHMANIPMPESGKKCPRCESTSTKFCYFNNYSLSQPRHFCKTCRRYWTCGGALRSVPVGGGCRRNKRIKRNNRSKSSAATAAATSSTTSGGCGGISSTSTSTTASADVVIDHNLPPPGVPSQLFPFLPPLYSTINDYVPGNVGFNFETSRKIGGIDMDFQTGSTASGGRAILPSGVADQQWRQFPFFGSNNLQTSSSSQVGFYQLESVQGTSNHQVLSNSSDSARISAVKMDEMNRGLNRSTNFSGTPETGQYWLGTTDTGTVNAWSGDQSHGFSSSTSHLP